MTEKGNVIMEKEFETLREELLQAKKYVFERHLLVVALGFGGITLFSGPYLAALPLAIAVLLLFNFWFTTNRLRSAARIVAYIQLELEEKKIGRWVGWETCLRYYRIWKKTASDKKLKSIDDEIDEDAVPDAMMYYPPIHKLHTIFMIATLVSAVIITFLNFSLINILSTVGVGIALYKYYPYYKDHNPKWARRLIERNRVIWIHVFNDMVSKGVK